MAENQGTLELIAREVGRAIQPLEVRLSTSGIRGLLAELGVQFPPDLVAAGGFINALQSSAAEAAKFPSLVENISIAIQTGDSAKVISIASQIMAAVPQLISAFDSIATELGGLSGTLPGMNPAIVQNFTANLAEQLLGYLVVSYLEGYFPVTLNVLALLGLVSIDIAPGVSGDPTQPPYMKKSLNLSVLGDLLKSPESVFQSLYGWGAPGFDGVKLLSRLHGLLFALRLPAFSQLSNTGGAVPTLRFLPLELSPKLDVNPPGLQATLQIDFTDGFQVLLPVISDGWNLEIKVKGTAGAGTGVIITPTANLSIVPPSGIVSGETSIALTAGSPDPSKPLIVFGKAGESRIEASSISLGFNATYSWDAAANSAKGSLGFEAGVRKGKIAISLSDADGFLSSVLPRDGISFDFDFAVGWSQDRGIYFNGGAGLELSIPLHLNLGPVSLSTLYLVIGADGDGIKLEMSVAAGANFGPLAASIDRIGFSADCRLHRGNLGPIDLSLAFKPPNGIGLSVNAGIVTGGGYLYIDPDGGEYDGVLQLMIADLVGVTAIGLITTKMPDGSSGFSLLIIMTADFGAGFQLGFGFTLLAVGGLLGLNRSMQLQALVDGVRTDAIESVMFPQNVIANAPRIISDLRTFFPPQDGVFLVGPMAKIGWGEPTLISLSLGIIIEIPPGDVVILGVLKLALPADDIAILLLQVNFIGALEIDKSRFWFYATLYDSHVLFITLEGSMGVLFAFGDNANFVVSIGGFHPQFKPPPLPFPTPTRLALNIINESYARIRCSGYFAVTSNTVQFGAQSEYYFGFSALNIQGHSGFDALIQFSPFHFSVSISTSFSVELFGFGMYGIGMSLTVEGPAPWHIHGEASLSFLFFSIDIPVDFTFGDNPNTMLPPVRVMPILVEEFGKSSNWRALLPTGSNLLVSLRQLDPSEAALILHPVGTLKVSQRAVPLDLTLDKVGNQQPSDANKFTLTITSGGLREVERATEAFASAQFQKMSDADKLSKQPYTQLDSGIELSSTGSLYASATTTVRNVRYDLTVLDVNKQPVFTKFYRLPASLFAHFFAGASVARNPLSSYVRTLGQPVRAKVSVNSETFAVANVANNTVFHPQSGAFTSELTAGDYLKSAVANDPSLSGQLHVIPQFEVAA